MSSTKKIEEALVCIREAEKSLKTGFLKWKPDYDIAADEYNKAATCYKTAKQYTQCRECLLKAAENYKYCRSLFAAAKCIEQAAHISKELEDFDAVASYSERAAGLYREHGVCDTAALCLDKSAKLVETKLPDKALHLYKYAVEIVMTEDRPRQAAEFQTKLCKLLLRMQRFNDAAEAIRKEILLNQAGENDPMIGRSAVGLVLVHIARGDTVAADKAFREWGGFCDQEEVRTLSSLLQAFDEGDGDLARRALNSPFIKHMDVEYSKLARDLPVPKGSSKHTDSNKGAFAAGDGDDVGRPDAGNEELDLC